MKINKKLIFLLSLTLLIAFSGSAFAASTPQKITSINSINNFDLIYNRGFNFYAASGDIVVWSDGLPGNRDIYYKNLANGTSGTLCNAQGDQVLPCIEGDRVIWEDWRTGSPQIYLYDLQTQTETLLVNITLQSFETSISHWRPALSGDIVVWTDFRNGNYDIYSYNIATQETRQITSDPVMENFPVINGNNIAYQKNTSDGFDVYLYNYETAATSILSSDPGWQFMLSIDNEDVLWCDGRKYPTQQPNTDLDIYGYDLVSKYNFLLTDVPGNQTWPRKNGNVIIMQTVTDGSDFDIYYFIKDPEGIAGTYPIATTSAEEIQPDVQGNRVFWLEQNGTQWDLYTANIEGNNNNNLSLNTSILGQSSVLFNPNPFSATQVILSGTDGNKAIYTSPTWTVTDGRGTGAGWYATMSATVPTSSNGKTISLSNLFLFVDNIDKAVNASTSSNPLNLGRAQGVSLETPQTLLSSPQNEGMGSFTFVPRLELNIPANSFAGEYISTLYVTTFESSPTIN